MVNFLLPILVFLIPFYSFRFSVLGIPTNILEILVVLFFLYSIFHIFYSRRRIVFGTIWPWLFLSSGLIGVIVAGIDSDSLGIFKGWFLAPILFYWSIINLREKFDLRTIYWSLYASLMIVSVWGILQYFGIIGLLFYQIGDSNLAQYLQPDNLRAFGPFNSPNFLAMYIVPALFISSFGYFSIKSLCLKNIFLISLFLPIIALVMSGSRAGIIALIAGVIVLVVFKLKQQLLSNKWLIFAGILISGAIIWLLTQAFTGRSGGDEVRVQIWKYSLEMLRGKWLFGIGLGEFQNHIIAMVGDNTRWTQELVPYALHPHNIFLAVWINLGLLGIVSFCAIIINFFRSRPNAYFLAAMIAILIHGLFDTTYFKNDLSIIFWLIVAVSVLKNEKNISKS